MADGLDPWVNDELDTIYGDLSLAETIHLENADAQADDPSAYGYVDRHITTEIMAELVRRKP